MAYLRKEKEAIEISYPIETIWTTIPKVITTLQWKILEKDDNKHQIKTKTKGGFMSYPSIIIIDLKSIDQKTTKMTVSAETPTTTITSIADFGRTKDRIEMFIEALAKEMNKQPS